VPRYAQKTQVPSARSREEIERTLQRYGADRFQYGWDVQQALIRFTAHDRLIEFRLPMPDRDSDEFWLTPTGKRRRDAAAAEREYEQAVRQRWRALALVLKAKLEAVEAGISEFEQEFLANILLPDGKTVGNWMAPQIEAAYESGEMPRRLLELPSA
jgi:hypothetical protein